MLNFKGMPFPINVNMFCIRWYAAYPLSYWHLEEMMEERGLCLRDCSPHHVHFYCDWCAFIRAGCCAVRKRPSPLRFHENVYQVDACR
jgi:hypothetical protein